MSHFQKRPELKIGAEIIKGNYHPINDWEMDEQGYILIRINQEKKLLELGFCKRDNIIEILFQGKKPQDIYHEVSIRKLISRPEHYAYMGKELEKAYLALKYDLEYIQDDELNIR